MALEEKINADIKSAMLAKEASKLDALRAIKSAILLLKTSTEGLNDDTEMKTKLKRLRQKSLVQITFTSSQSIQRTKNSSSLLLSSITTMT